MLRLGAVLCSEIESIVIIFLIYTRIMTKISEIDIFTEHLRIFM